MKHVFKKLFVTLLPLLFLVSTGCEVQKTQIAYTSYPIGYLIKRIGGDAVHAVSIQNDESTIQVATLKEDYVTILENSEVFFHVGDVEPYNIIAERFVKDGVIKDGDLSGLNAIYLNQRYIPVYEGSRIVSYLERPYYTQDTFESIDMTYFDLNLWIHPITMLSMADSIYHRLVDLYPDLVNTFKENFDYLKLDLVRLDAQYQKLSERMQENNSEIKFVSTTNSFGSWQKAYGVQVYPLVLSQYGVLPSEAQLEYMKQRIMMDNVKYFAYESNLNDPMNELALSIIEELGLVRVDLNNISSLTQAQLEGNKDYLTLMYENLAALDTMLTSREGLN